MINRKFLFGLSFLIFGFSCWGQIEDRNTRDSLVAQVAENNRIFFTLIEGKEKAQQKITDTILKNPNNFIPPVLFAMSQVIFNDGKKKKALFWFLVAQIRAKYDANLSREDLQHYAHKVISLYEDEFGQSIKKYAAQHVFQLEKVIRNAIRFIKENKSNYNHRWIFLDKNIPNIDLNKLQALTKPENEWGTIKAITVNNYYSEMIKYFGKNNQNISH